MSKLYTDAILFSFWAAVLVGSVAAGVYGPVVALQMGYTMFSISATVVAGWRVLESVWGLYCKLRGS